MFNIDNISRYKYHDTSAHILDQYKLMDLRDVTPNHIDSSDDDNDRYAKDFPDSPVIKNGYFEKNLNSIQNSLINQFNSCQKPKYPSFHHNERGNSYYNGQEKISNAISEIDQVLQMGNSLYSNEKQENKWKINDLLGKYVINDKKNKPKDPKRSPERNAKRKEIEEARKRYEQKTNEIYHNNNNNNITQNTDISMMMRTKDMQEMSQEEEKQLPYIEPFIVMKNMKNIDKIKGNNDDLNGFHDVFQINKKKENYRIFENTQNTFKNIENKPPIIDNNNNDKNSYICLDCRNMLSFDGIETHISTCLSQENIEKLMNLPRLNKEELERINANIEDILANFANYEIKSVYYTDTISQIKTILINSNLVILSTAIKRIEYNIARMDIGEEIGNMIRSIINLAKEKIFVLKFIIKDQNIYRQKMLYQELKQLEMLTEEAEKDLLEEIATKNVNGSNSYIPEQQVKIDSDIESDEDFYVENSNIYNQSGKYVKNDINSHSPVKKSFENERNKREFYSEAVRIKLSLPNNHKGREIVISELYDECIAMKIERNQWENFIKTRMKNIK